MIDALAIPDTASLIDHGSGEAISWPAFADGCRSDLEGRRKVFGIHADNGLETVRQIVSVLMAGGLPAPFPGATRADQRDNCLARLGATALWTPGDGWQDLGGARVYPPGFELVMHSSGSTGWPKPLAIRLRAMRRNALDVGAALGIGPHDVHLGTMSQCYMSGFYNATILPLVTGARTISLPVVTPLTTDVFLQAVHRHRPTILWLNPLIARLLTRMRKAPADLFSSVRRVISCTAALPDDVKTAFEQRFGVPLLQSYGLCETLITTVEDPDALAPATVGRPVGAGRPVTIGADGRIVVANGALFAGYLDAELPRESPEEFATEDLGAFDAAGNLVILGRLSEVINRNGVKFSPAQVEEAMQTVSGVDDCALLARPDPRLETKLVACIVSGTADKKRLERAVRERLPAHQQPHEILFVNSIPRTASGKIDRPLLNESVVQCP